MFLMGSLLWWIAGAGVVSIPLVIHLLHRQRTQTIQWGAMQFLLQTPVRFRRRRQIDHWLLLLLRTAALGLLVLLLARPLWNHLPAALGGGGSRARDVVIIIDHSLSAGRQSGDTTPFTQAVRSARQIVESLGPQDGVSIILAEHQPRALSAAPIAVSGADRLLSQLDSTPPGLTDASVPDALGLASEVLARGRNPNKLTILAMDNTRAGWAIDNASAWAGVRTTATGGRSVMWMKLPIDDAPADLSVQQVQVSPSVLGVQRPARITASIRNLGKAASPPCQATLSVAGRVVSKYEVPSIPAASAQDIGFDHGFDRAGATYAEVRVDSPDSLEANNAATLGIDVLAKLPVLLVDGSFTDAAALEHTAFLRAAMQPVIAAREADTLIQTRTVSVRDFDSEKLEGFPLVVLNDVSRISATSAERLADHARAGNAVWIILGSRCDGPLLAGDLARGQLFDLDRPELSSRATSGASPTLDIQAPNNPMVRLIATADRNPFSAGDLSRWWKVRVRDAGAQVVLATGEGDPLVVERSAGRNGGKIVVWTTSADRSWNNWPTLANFVPLVNETVYHLSAGALATAPRTVRAGEPLEWISGSGDMPTAGQVLSPDKSPHPVRLTLSNGKSVARYYQTQQPGLYELRFTTSNVAQPVYFGVGLSASELETATLSDQDMRWLEAHAEIGSADIISPGDAIGAGGSRGAGVELWPYLAGTLGVLLVSEAWMTWSMIRHQTAEASVAVPAAVSA